MVLTGIMKQDEDCHSAQERQNPHLRSQIREDGMDSHSSRSDHSSVIISTACAVLCRSG